MRVKLTQVLSVSHVIKFAKVGYFNTDQQWALSCSALTFHPPLNSVTFSLLPVGIGTMGILESCQEKVEFGNHLVCASVSMSLLAILVKSSLQGISHHPFCASSPVSHPRAGCTVAWMCPSQLGTGDAQVAQTPWVENTAHRSRGKEAWQQPSPTWQQS